MKNTYRNLIFILFVFSFLSFAHAETVGEKLSADIDLTFVAPTPALTLTLESRKNLSAGFMSTLYPVADIELTASELSRIGIRWTPTDDPYVTRSKQVKGTYNSNNILYLEFSGDGVEVLRDDEVYYVTIAPVTRFDTTVNVIAGTEVHPDLYAISMDAALWVK